MFLLLSVASEASFSAEAYKLFLMWNESTEASKILAYNILTSVQ